LFYLINQKIENKLILFLLGIFNTLNVLTRPSNLLVFLILSVWILFSIKKYLSRLIFYLLPVILLFSISSINAYKTDGKFEIFTKNTQGIYDMQVKQGIKNFKYETSSDKKYKNSGVHYLNNLYTDKLSNVEDCNSSVECVGVFLKKSPVNYVLISSIHLFTLFDRNYINTYIKNMDEVDITLIMYNYLILSSVVCYFVFFVDLKEIKKRWKLLFTSVLIIISTIVIYIPTIVESRFSSSIYPFLVMFAAFYFYKLIKIKKMEHFIKIIVFQIALIILFSIISYLIRQSVVLYLS
jgi:hypothetical protein